MTKKIIWMLVSCLMVLSLVMASCGPAEEEAEVEIEEGEVTIVGEAEEEEEEVEEEVVVGEGLLSPDVPKYGGVFIDTGGDPFGWDPGIMQSIFIFWSRFMNEPLFITDWSKGPAGTDQVDFQFGYMGMGSLLRGALAESYELPDEETIIFHIRKGVHWWDKPPVNGR